MSEPNPQEGMAPGNPPPRPPEPAAPTPAAASAEGAPGGGINLTVVVIGIAVLLVGAMIIMVAMSGSDGGGGVEGETVTTKSGLKYTEVKIGAGKVAKKGDKVEVHYTGTFTNGKKFDSSRDRNEPLTFSIGKGMVIKGWDEGVAGMKEGGKRKLYVPFDLGYGPRGKPPTIPPATDLVFEVELLKVN